MSHLEPGGGQPIHRPPPIVEQPMAEIIAASPASGLQAKKGGDRNVLYFILAVAVGVVAVLGGFVLLRPADESLAGELDPSESQATEDGSGEVADTAGSSETAADVETAEEDGSVPPSPTTTVEEQTTTQPTAAPTKLEPIAAGASNTRAAIGRLRCGGSNRFDPNLLIDGDPNTGWGARDGDGSGEWIRIDFGRQVRLVEVGLTPGYLRTAPRSDQGCQSVSAFTFNRFVEEVTYTFDDGSSVAQRFRNEGRMQRKTIDEVVTESVWITIVSTQPATDPDTIISDAEFYGFEQ